MLLCADGFQYGAIVTGTESQCFCLFQQLLVGICESESQSGSGSGFHDQSDIFDVL